LPVEDLTTASWVSTSRRTAVWTWSNEDDEPADLQNRWYGVRVTASEQDGLVDLVDTTIDTSPRSSGSR
jgi:hypothetical protein